MPLHGKNLIGASVSAQGTATFRAIDPSADQAIGPDFFAATDDEAERALDLADRAFRSRRRPDPRQDASLLRAIADRIEAMGEELVERCCAETGLPAGRIQMERARTCHQLRLFSQVVAEGSWVDARIDRAMPDRQPAPKPDLRRMLVPLGPVVVFPASNFPLAFSVAGGDVASALGAGCPVIVKARPSHPGTSELVGTAVQRAAIDTGMPDGWFSMLHGAGRELGLRLVGHPAVRAVGFTGSLSGGRALCRAADARPRPIPVYAEMGSINPVFLMPGAMDQRAEQIAAGMHQSVTLGVGQFCTNPGLVIAQEGAALDRFLGELCRRIEATEPATMLFGAILRGYEAGGEALAKSPGVKLAARSKQAPDPAKTQAAAAVYLTDAETFLHNAELAHEVFGPCTLVVRCRSVSQMVDIARRIEGQLTCTIHATEEELPEYGELLAAMEASGGRILFGGFPTGVEVCASMHHGGPCPATTDPHVTSVGTAAIHRFARPICYQSFPQDQLPPELRNKNLRGIWRLIDNVLTKDDIE